MGVRVDLPTPHPGMRVVMREMKRFNWLCAGRRWRKTTLAMIVCVEHALKGEVILWCAPTSDQAMICWREARKALGNLIVNEVVEPNLTRKEIVFPGRGMMFFRSLEEPDNIRGHTANGVVIDEAEEVMDVRVWHEIIRPMLVDTNGWALSLFTPKPGAWCVREWELAKEREDSRAWQAPTLGVAIEQGQLVRRPHPLENPHIPFEEIVSLWRSMPERSFRQEILAEIVEEEGAVFRRVRSAITNEVAKYRPEHQYVIGVDWGRSADFSCFVVIDATDKQVVDIDRSTGVEYAIQRGRLLGLCRKWQPVKVVAEENAMGAPIIEQLLRDGVPIEGFVTTRASKAMIIDELSLALEQGVLKLIDNPTLIAELSAYRAERLPSGAIRYGAPPGMHDDTVMALALAWHGARPVASKEPFVWKVINKVPAFVGRRR